MYLGRQLKSYSGVENGRPITRCVNRRKLARLFQVGLIIVLIVTIAINVIFIMDTNSKLHQTGSRGANYADMNGEVASARKHLTIEILSSSWRVSVTVDGTTIMEDSEKMAGRGVHVVILNQATGSMMSHRMFDIYEKHEDEQMLLFLNIITLGRILIFAIKDEGTFQMGRAARERLVQYGSKKAKILHWRDTWAMVAIQGDSKVVGETHSKSRNLNSWGTPVLLKVDLQLKNADETECQWHQSDINKRRRAFCNKLEGYGSVCNCDNPAPLEFNPAPIQNSKFSDVPVAVIAGNRPHYLFRMLRGLLSTPGVQPNLVTVFIDGYFEEPLLVTQLFGLRGIQHTPISIKNARIGQHYKSSLTATFNLFPDAKYMLILEEDVDVATDIFSYFSQTLHLLEEDSSIYCISAWNDQGYEHSCRDPALLYRVETMPGLGWILKRKLYKEELELKWPTPEKLWDWDMWMRMPGQRKGRECIIPDVSRTYHFGAKGLNMNTYFHELYFANHKLNSVPDVKLKDVERMKANEYEAMIENMISQAKALNHSESPCSMAFVPKQPQDQVYVAYIRMDHASDWTTYKQMAKCFHLWDLDIRGFHKSMFRFFLKKSHIIIVGVPASPYSKLKPAHIQPIYMPLPTTVPTPK